MSRTPPPPSKRSHPANSSSSIDTPFRRNSGSVVLSAFSDDCPPSKTVRPSMDVLLEAELRDATIPDNPRFFDHFPLDFSDIWDYACTAGFYSRKDGRWSFWPSARPTESAVCTWFDNTVTPLLDVYAARHARPVYTYARSGALPLAGGDCVRSSDLVVTTAPHPRGNRIHWTSVRVVGELKENAAELAKESTLIQLANYVREVFGAQPSRRWVYAFMLCGTMFRCWMFDRSGASGSVVVDIHHEPALFLRALLSYATMAAEDLGFDPTLRCDDQGGVEHVYDPTILSLEPEATRCSPHIWVPKLRSQPSLPGPVKLMFRANPLVHRPAIVSRGTVIWKATFEGSEYCVKHQWRAAERISEGALMRLIGQDVRGLPNFEYYEDQTEDGEPVDITRLRRRIGMESNDLVPVSPVPAPSLRRTSEESDLGSPPQKRSSTSQDDPKAKRTKMASGTTAPPMSLPFANRVLTRIILTPVGRPLYKSKTYTELLMVFLDAIHGHRFLYKSLEILHRDVSPDNVLLAPPGSHCTGLLIDFDMAVRVGRDMFSGAPHRTGTPNFMAVGILKGTEPHNPLHDLESFFYVLLWVCTFYDIPSQTPMPKVKSDFFPADVAMAQRDLNLSAILREGFMLPHNFSAAVEKNFCESARELLHDLISGWRAILFPPREGSGSGPPSDSAIDRGYIEAITLLESGITSLQGR